MSVLWSGKFKRKDDGTLDLNTNAFPQQAAEQGVVGDPNPDWTGGFGATVDFWDFSLSALFETSQGGDMWGGTQAVLRNFGVDPSTAVETTASQDLPEYNGNIISKGTTFRGVEKDFGGGPVALTQAWWASLGGGFAGVGEQDIYDASWTRLRSVSLSYSIPKDLLSPVKLKGVSLSVSARNVWLITSFPGIDPESSLVGASNGRGLNYFNNPGSKSYIVGVKVNL